jgi:sugar/nucleoside kinase (ribokinase family)
MSTVVVGSIALDTVETPYGKAEEALGGTAVFFSVAASHFTEVNIVGVVGTDFPDAHIELLQARGCNCDGLQRQEGRTFRWVGSYDENMNIAHTLDTQLNVFEAFRPGLPLIYRHARTVFLGNIHPELQDEVLHQTESPQLVALDTMNFWIERTPEALKQVIRKVDVVLVNEDEARQFAGVYKISEAARFIREMGPHTVVIKRGEYGAALYTEHGYYALPAFPTEHVWDTTGAGDSFAGGFLGYLDSVAATSHADLRRALAYGTVIASFAVENFSIRGLENVGLDHIDDRYEALRDLTAIEPARELSRIPVQRGA